MPHDLQNDEDSNDYGDLDDNMDEEGEADVFGNYGEEEERDKVKLNDEEDEDHENDVFAMAREN